MTRSRNSSKSRKSRPVFLGKPLGVIQPRVQAVGPQHFGIVAVDCAKARSKWMFCDFYGKVLIAPRVVEHTQPQFDAAVRHIREACQEHDIRDLIVAIEMTGTYHLPVKRAFRSAGFETRLVHPFASQHYRLPVHADNKTDDTDLEAIFRAAVNGFGLLEPASQDIYLVLKLLARQRRDLVQKRARLHSQIREWLGRVLPGYDALFPSDELWDSPVALPLARWAPSAGAIRDAGVHGILQYLRQQGRRFQHRTVERIVAWAGNAAPADPMAPLLARLWMQLDDDRQAKTQLMRALERELAAALVQTPYILLLTQPGIQVTSGGELAGEMGPIAHYGHAKAITGRAGLFPSRYQSDQVDHADGAVARSCNHRLRAAWLRVADNLIKCHSHFRGKAQLWKSQGVDPRDIRTRIANRATRGVFQMVSGRQVFAHPSRMQRHYLLEKLYQFHIAHETPIEQIGQDLKCAAQQLPASACAEEAAQLRVLCQRLERARSRAPEPVRTMLRSVLADLQMRTEPARPAAEPGQSGA